MSGVMGRMPGELPEGHEAMGSAEISHVEEDLGRGHPLTGTDPSGLDAEFYVGGTPWAYGIEFVDAPEVEHDPLFDGSNRQD